MFSISEVQESSDFKNIAMFKAWWDILLDYLVAATTLNILLLLGRMASVDTGGLICIHPFANYSYGYVESRYVNSRCCSNSTAWIIIFHPYIMLFLWMCITATHVCWIKIPAINTKMEAFYAILYKIFTIQPKFYRNPYSLRMTQEFAYNEVNQKAINVLLNKLLYLMTEKPFLRYSYMAKHCVIIFFCTVSIAHAVFVISFLSNYPSSFDCFLKHIPPTMRGYPFPNNSMIATPCHLNIGPFIYVLIHFDCFIRIIMVALSIKGFIWTYRNHHKETKKKKVNLSSILSNNLPVSEEPPRNDNDNEPETEQIFGEATEYLSGMPSYPDLLFCIELLKRNVHDGHLMYEAICTSIRNYVTKLKDIGGKYTKKPKSPGNDVKCDVNLEYEPKTYHESVVFVRWMCHELGLEEVPNMMDSNNLFDCLQFIKDSLGFQNFSRGQNMRTIIVNYIRSHPELFRTLLDEDPIYKGYEAHCDYLSDPNNFGSHFSLLAAATLMNINIVIVHCEATKNLPDIYLPLKQSALVGPNIKNCIQSDNQKSSATSITTKFLTYVSPHLYHATTDMPVTSDWPHIVGKRMLYLADQKFRWGIRQSAIRSIIHGDLYSHNQKTHT